MYIFVNEYGVTKRRRRRRWYCNEIRHCAVENRKQWIAFHFLSEMLWCFPSSFQARFLFFHPSPLPFSRRFCLAMSSSCASERMFRAHVTDARQRNVYELCEYGYVVAFLTHHFKRLLEHKGWTALLVVSMLKRHYGIVKHIYKMFVALVSCCCCPYEKGDRPPTSSWRIHCTHWKIW